jgi:rhodanese-related sulfurtransferase
MKTMDWLTLETLIENHAPVNLIDIRQKNEFREIHIPGARSFPFAELASPEGFLRYRRTAEQIYIVSDDQVRASLAAGILRALGYMNAMVIEGGMKAWMALGLPVSRKRPSLPLPNLLSAIAALFAIAGIAFPAARSKAVAAGACAFFRKTSARRRISRRYRIRRSRQLRSSNASCNAPPWGDLRHHGDQDRTPCSKDDIVNCIRHGVAKGREFALRLFLNGAKRSGDRPCPGTSTSNDDRVHFQQIATEQDCHGVRQNRDHKADKDQTEPRLLEP